MFLTNSNSIKEVLLFPAMKPTEQGGKAASGGLDAGSMARLEDQLASMNFLGGDKPSKADAAAFEPFAAQGGGKGVPAEFTRVKNWATLMESFPQEARTAWE